MKIIDTDGGFAAREILKLEWSSCDSHYRCFVELENWPLTKRGFYFVINSKICSLLTSLALLTKGCTKDSIQDFLSKYPYTYRMIRTNFLDDSEFGWGENYIHTSALCSKNSLIEKAKEYAYIIDNLQIELEELKLDTSKLIRKEPIKFSSDVKIPKWLKYAVAVGGVILIKGAVKSFVNNADIDIEIPNFDGDTDVATIDIEAGDINPSDNNDCDANNGYNVSFGANENADGFIPDGKISLERTISGSTDSFPHYTKDGHDYVKVGSSYIRVDSGQTVTINNITYDTV
jgi:hypothetical protein